MKKRIMSILLAIALCLTAFPIYAIAATSGTFGSGMRWSYSTSTKTLTISGTGNIPDYSGWGGQPWADYCEEIESITLRSGVKRVGDYAFGSDIYSFSLPNLSSISFSSTITEIGMGAFMSAGKLTSVTLPSSLVSIESGAFSYTPLETVTIPSKTTEIGYSVFSDCSSLKEITVLPNNPIYFSVDGVLFYETEDDVSLICYPHAKPSTTYSIPEGTTRILEYTFAWNQVLTSISVPGSVRVIEPLAFLGCESLSKVSLGEGIESLSSAAFWCCSSLKSLSIPASVSEMTTSVYPGGDWYGASQNMEVHFAGDAPKKFDGGLSELYQGSKYQVTIYYPPDAEGWDSLRDQYASLQMVFKEASSQIPVNSSDEEEVTDIVEEKLSNKNFLNNIISKMSKLRGPQINIAGKTFDLFDISSNLDIRLGDKGTVQFKLDQGKKTVQILLGFKPISGSTTIVGDPKSPDRSDASFEQSFSDAKDLYKMVVGGHGNVNSSAFRSKFNALSKNLEEFDVDLIVKASSKICGYLELSYETGELVFSEGGLIMSVSLKQTKNGRIPSLPVCYLTIRFDLSAEGKIRAVAEDDSIFFDPAFDADIKTAIAVGLGKNTGLFQAYLEGGFEGDLGAHIRPTAALTGEDPFSADLTGSLYFEGKIKIGIWDIGEPLKRELFKLGLYPKLELLSEIEQTPPTMEELLANSNLITRDYLYAPSLQSIFDDYSFSKIEYPYSEPTLLRLTDGRMLLVWVGDNGEKASEDRTSIFYSVYEQGQWSAPAVVHESGTYNDHPILCQSQNSVYMVWMRADSSLVGVTAEETFAHMDLVFSTFDGTSWTQPQMISEASNGIAETDYALAANGNTITVAWVQNSNNDLFMASGTNSIHLRTCSQANWGKEWTLLETSTPISGLDIDQSNTLQITYSLSNGEETTTYLSNETGEAQVIQGAEQEARWANGHLYELRNTTLYCDGVSTGLENLTNFEIVSSANQTVVLTLVSTGFCCELFGSYYDAGSNSWGAWVQLSNYGKYIRNYSAVLDESGKIVAALNLISVDSDADAVYNNASAVLAVVDDCRYRDLVVEDWLLYDIANVAPGGSLPLSFQIANQSPDPLRSVLVSAMGQTKQLTCNVAPGESALLQAVFTLPDHLAGYEITLTVEPDDDLGEANTGNNSAHTVIGLADLELQVSSPEVQNTGAEICVNIRNSGYLDAQDISLRVLRSNGNGELLQEISLGSLEAGQEWINYIKIPDDMLSIDDSTRLSALAFEVVSASEEENYGNNQDRAVFGNLSPLTVNYSSTSEHIALQAFVSNRQAEACNSVIIAAMYNNYGKLLSTDCQSLQLSPNTTSNVSFLIDYPKLQDEVTIKVFWCNADGYVPLTTAWESRFEKP